MVEHPISDQVGHSYRSLMNEIKFRVESLNQALGGELAVLKPVFIEEFCYLQLRMICELIAFGCLIVHGTLKPRQDLFKTHKADWIAAELSKLHSDFFPKPIELTETAHGPTWTIKKGGYLTMAELKRLSTRECGKHLHRGSAKDVIDKPLSPQLPKVAEWRNKIGELLEHHYIVTPDTNYLFEVSMNLDGKVASRTLTRQGLVVPH
jgi:hypothetical protein